MKEVFGGIIMAIGILISGASGLCSLVMLFGSGGELGGTMEMLPLILMIGGIPFAVGGAIVFGGYMLFRSGRDDKNREEQ